MTAGACTSPPHWPDFGAHLCGDMTDRMRLGLPDNYLGFGWEARLQQASRRIRGFTEAALLSCMASSEAGLADRIAAGNQLALTGDPRIRTDAPAMVEIDGGTVAVGLSPCEVDAVIAAFSGLGLDRAWIAKECPRHSMILAPYRLAKYPVTNAEFLEFLIETGYSEIPTSWHFRRFPAGHSNHPVYTVSPVAADYYAHWLSERTGRAFRLPSEAEWEWAAAGPAGLEFPWGAAFDVSRANTAETGLFDTTPVGVFLEGTSWAGLHDMAGNVEEYVCDDYHPYPGGDFVADHLVDIHGAYRIARGGSFARFRDLSRTRRRHGHNPRSATYAMGFRLAESS